MPDLQSPAFAAPPPGAYRPRRPEATVLHRVVREHLRTFLASVELPRRVAREFLRYLDCGMLPCGFARVRCDACGKDLLVAFSCKGRLWASCNARRMHDTAAHLVDRVLPRARYRQWVLSVPHRVRFLLARHMLFLEGVYRLVDGKPEFHAVPPPEHAEIEETLLRIQGRLLRHLRKRGLVPKEGEESGTGEEPDEPGLLAACQAASVSNRIALGERAGHRVRRMGSFGLPGESPFSEGPRCVGIGGFSLHADVSIRAHERERLEKLSRYIARPPVAETRLYRTQSGQIAYRVKRMWSDGTQALLFSPMEFMEKLAALIPQPRIHLARFHGVLAPHHAWREGVVPRAESAEPGEQAHREREGAKARSSAKHRLTWAELLKRVFQIDLTVCPDCGGAVKLVAAIVDRRIVRKILEDVGLPADPPPVTPARAPPMEAMSFF